MNNNRVSPYISLGCRDNPDCGLCANFQPINTEAVGGLGLRGICSGEKEISLVFQAWTPTITLRMNRNFEKAKEIEEGEVSSCHVEKVDNLF